MIDDVYGEKRKRALNVSGRDGLRRYIYINSCQQACKLLAMDFCIKLISYLSCFVPILCDAVRISYVKEAVCDWMNDVVILGACINYTDVSVFELILSRTIYYVGSR